MSKLYALSPPDPAAKNRANGADHAATKRNRPTLPNPKNRDRISGRTENKSLQANVNRLKTREATSHSGMPGSKSLGIPRVRLRANAKADQDTGENRAPNGIKPLRPLKLLQRRNKSWNFLHGRDQKDQVSAHPTIRNFMVERSPNGCRKHRSAICC